MYFLRYICVSSQNNTVSSAKTVLYGVSKQYCSECQNSTVRGIETVLYRVPLLYCSKIFGALSLGVVTLFAGGSANIARVYSCFTRVHVALVDKEKAERLRTV